MSYYGYFMMRAPALSNYKLGAALIYTLFMLAVQKTHIFPQQRFPILLSRIVVAGCL